MSAPTPRLSHALALAVLALIAACGDESEPAPPTPDATCEGAKCDFANAEPIPAATWGRCHIEAGAGQGGADVLMCGLSPSTPVTPHFALAEVRPADDVRAVTGVIPLDGTTAPVLELEPSAYPARLGISLSFSSDLDVEGITNVVLTRDVQLTSAASLSADAPLTLKQPFDLWPVQILGATEIFIFNEADASRDIAPFYVGSGGEDPGDRTMTAPVSFAVREGQVLSLYVIPGDGHTAPITGEAQLLGPDQTITREAVTIDGPGQYVADDGGLRPPTDEERPLFADADPTVGDNNGTNNGGNNGGTNNGTNDGDANNAELCDADFLPWLDELSAKLTAVGSPPRASQLADLEAFAATRPCDATTAASYARWLPLFTGRLDAFAPNGNPILNPDERRVVDVVQGAAPAPTDSASYTTWLAAHDARLEAFAPDGNPIVNDDEQTVLDRLTAVRPLADGEEAFLAWFASYNARLEAFAPDGNPIVNNDERELLTHYVGLRPVATGPSAWATWFEAWEARFTAFAPTGNPIVNNDEAALLDELTSIRPLATDGGSWALWWALFEARLEAAGGSLSADEAASLERVLTVKPCPVEDAEAAATWQARLDGENVAQKRSLIEAAAPTSCE